MFSPQRYCNIIVPNTFPSSLCYFYPKYRAKIIKFYPKYYPKPKFHPKNWLFLPKYHPKIRFVRICNLNVLNISICNAIFRQAVICNGTFTDKTRIPNKTPAGRQEKQRKPPLQIHFRTFGMAYNTIPLFGY